MKPTLAIMAAGMGSRYGGLKQIDPMGPSGEILMEYSVYDAIRAGFGKVVFIIRREFADLFEEQIARKFSDRIEVAYAFQELDALPAGFTVPEGRVKPWGTGQAILSCRSVVDTPFVVQNADDYYGVEAYKVIAEELCKMEDNCTDSCMVGFEISKTLSDHGYVSRGVCEARDGYLSDIVERLQIARNEKGIIQYFENGTAFDMRGDEVVSVNFWGFAPTFFNALEKRFVEFLAAEGSALKSEWLIPPVIDEMIKKGETRVKILRSRDSWFGVTYPEDKPRVVNVLAGMHANGTYPENLWG